MSNLTKTRMVGTELFHVDGRAGGQVGRWASGQAGKWAGGQVGRWAGMRNYNRSLPILYLIFNKMVIHYVHALSDPVVFT